MMLGHQNKVKVVATVNNKVQMRQRNVALASGIHWNVDPVFCVSIVEVLGPFLRKKKNK
jgi:hypothetical protein